MRVSRAYRTVNKSTMAASNTKGVGAFQAKLRKKVVSRAVCKAQLARSTSSISEHLKGKYFGSLDEEDSSR